MFCCNSVEYPVDICYMSLVCSFFKSLVSCLITLSILIVIVEHEVLEFLTIAELFIFPFDSDTYFLHFKRPLFLEQF